MSRLSRLQTRLAKVNARIAEIEAGPYGATLKNKSYSVGYGNVSVTRQDFSAVADEYRTLLDEKDALEAEIDTLTGAENDSCFVAGFRGIQ